MPTQEVTADVGFTQPSLAQTIGEMRTARSWTQADLARRAGLSRSYIKALEDGEAQEPSGRTLFALSSAFEVDIVELMQAGGILPPDYRAGTILSDLDMAMYLRRQRKLSEAFVNMFVRLVRLADLEEHPEEGEPSETQE